MRIVALFAGMSGWAYPGWRGDFYEPGEPSGHMLTAYAEHFRTVEINNPFYRMPKDDVLAGWTTQVPPDFTFAIKANRRITQTKRPADGADAIAWFCDRLAAVGPHLGPVLFQLESRADLAQLVGFLALVRPRLARVVIEFRHPSWLTDEAFDILRAKDVALCQTETDDGSDPYIPASDFSYVRLRKSSYTAPELQERLNGLELLAGSSHDVYCYLKHEVENAVLLRDLRRAA
jgi:uncharacterized protein YecE (DUF72 family)